jgi:hypothetical protein
MRIGLNISIEVLTKGAFYLQKSKGYRYLLMFFYETQDESAGPLFFVYSG